MTTKTPKRATKRKRITVISIAANEKEKEEEEDRDSCRFRTRDRAANVEMLSKALTRSVATEMNEFEADPHELAADIEDMLYKKNSNRISRDYDDQLRSMLFNLQKKTNTALRDALLRGEITARGFVAMRAPALANPELLSARDSDAEWAKTIAMARSLDTSQETTAYTCRKCGKNKCRMTSLQTRSADEGMTTFISCISCGNRWSN
jgi:transcription elongation factor S-II